MGPAVSLCLVMSCHALVRSRLARVSVSLSAHLALLPRIRVERAAMLDFVQLLSGSSCSLAPRRFILFMSSMGLPSDASRDIPRSRAVCLHIFATTLGNRSCVSRAAYLRLQYDLREVLPLERHNARNDHCVLSLGVDCTKRSACAPLVAKYVASR